MANAIEVDRVGLTYGAEGSARRVGALRDVGYDGYWSLELFEEYYGIKLRHAPEEALAKGLAHLRRVIGEVYD